MKTLIKPNRLCKGDTVAAVSLSWGGAGDNAIRWRYELGKKRLEEIFGLKVIEMEHTLAGSEYIYQHPEKRAQDFMNAFRDPEVKGIISCIGGNESVRMLPYLDYNVIKNNPKLFSGFSDTTVAHFICMKAGLSSMYGASILTDFAENGAMFEYTKEWITKTWFESDKIGIISPANAWTSEFLPWEEKNKNKIRTLNENTGYEILQGNQTIKGRLIGGCIEVIEMIKGTEIFPSADEFEDTILFIETCEDMSPPILFEDWIRWLATVGIMERINGIILAKPYEEKFHEEYKQCICKVLKECNREDMPVMTNMNFGHTSPITCLPYGAMAEINCEKKQFSILESATV